MNGKEVMVRRQERRETERGEDNRADQQNNERVISVEFELPRQRFSSTPR